MFEGKTGYFSYVIIAVQCLVLAGHLWKLSNAGICPSILNVAGIFALVLAIDALLECRGVRYLYSLRV